MNPNQSSLQSFNYQRAEYFTEAARLMMNGHFETTLWDMAEALLGLAEQGNHRARLLLANLLLIAETIQKKVVGQFEIL